MSLKVGELYASLTLDNRDFNRGLKDSEEQGNSFGSSIRKVGEMAAGFLAANVIQGGLQKMTSAIGDSVSGWKDHLLVMAQTDAALKSTGGAVGLTTQQLEDMADGFKKNTLFEDDAIQSAENLLLTFTNIGGDVFPMATGAMLDMATAMHTDAAGGAIMLGKALNDPKNGLSALTRNGVVFTDQQKDMIAAMQDAGDMAGAQKIILAELNKEFGGSAKAASDAAGGAAKYADVIDDLQDTIGKKLMPVYELWQRIQITVGQWLVDHGIPAAEAFLGVVGRLGQFIGTKLAPPLKEAGEIVQTISGYMLLAAGISDDFTGSLEGLPGPLKKVTLIAGDLADDLRGLIPDLKEAQHFFSLGFSGGEAGGDLGKIQAAAYELGTTIRTDFLPPLREARDKFGEFVHFFTLGFEGGKVGGDLDTIARVAFNVGEAFATARDKIADALGKVQEKIGEFLGDNKKEVLEAIGLAFAYMGSAVVVGGLIALASALAGAAVALIAFAAPFVLIPAAIALVAFGIIELVKHWDDITARFPILGTVADAVQSTLVRFTGWIVASFLPAVRNIADTVADTVRRAVSFVRENWGTIQAIIEPAITAVLNIVKIGWQFINDEFRANIEIIKGIITLFTGIFTGDWGKMWDGIKEIAKGAWDEVSALFTFGKDAVIIVLGFLWDEAKAIFGKLGGWLSDKAGEIAGWLKDRFTDAKNNVVGLIGDLKQGAVDKFGELLTFMEGLPARLLNIAKDMGGAIRDGIIGGIKGVFGVIGNLEDALMSALKSLINQAIQAVNDAIPNSLSLSILGKSVGVDLPDNPIPYLARGARGWMGGAAVVGDQGPELVNLPHGANVFSNRDSARMLGGGGQPIIVNMPNYIGPASLVTDAVKAGLKALERNGTMRPVLR